VPAIEQTYPLSEMPNAMRHLEAGRARGKLVISVNPTTTTNHTTTSNRETLNQSGARHG
jgi:Zinc-binding dehydrogenase